MKADDHIRRDKFANVQFGRRGMQSRKLRRRDGDCQVVNAGESQLGRFENLWPASKGAVFPQFHLRLFDVGKLDTVIDNHLLHQRFGGLALDPSHKLLDDASRAMVRRLREHLEFLQADPFPDYYLF